MKACLSFQEQATDIQFLQYCSVCEGYKAPRSHHCRKCEILYNLLKIDLSRSLL